MWVLVVVAWLITFARAIPTRDGDRGVFVSMAERIAAGDTLYVDVWDNKEPFFFQTLALGRLISPFMDVVIELGWLVACSVAVWSMLRSLGVARAQSVFVGIAMTPLVITGAIYAAGFSHLPPTTLFLVTCALLMRRRFAWAGAAAVLIAFFKIIMLPMAIVAIGVALLRVRSIEALKRALLGSTIAFAVSAGLLLLRGEFVGYIKLLLSNVSYSQSSTTSAVLGPYQFPIWSHLEPVFTTSAVTIAAIILLILVSVRFVQEHSLDERVELLWFVTASTFVTAILIIAVTGLWPHHGQILAGPAVLSLALAAAAVPRLRMFRPAALITILVTALLLAGAPSLRATIDSGLSAPTRLRDLARIATPTQDLLSIADSGSYQRLGKNTDDSHAQGLRSFDLACYQFVQYTYDLPRTLEYIPECLPSADYLIVDKGLVAEDGAPQWNQFVAASEAVIARDFDCTPKDWGRLCVNRSNAASGT